MRVPGIRYVQGRNDYADGDRRKYGIAIHNTSNDATDEGEASYATWRPDGTSSHFYADADSVTQSIDTADRAGHAGSTHGNDHGISVEITGGNGKSRAWWLANVAWDKLGAVLAQVIRHHWPDGSFQVRRATVAQMRANPRVKAFYGHDDMRRAWGGTDHTDPGPNFPWDRLFAAVNTALTPPEDDDMTPDQLVNALKDPRVAAIMRRLPWQYTDPNQPSAHGIVLGEMRGGIAELRTTVTALLAAHQGGDTDTILAEIRAQADQTRQALVAAVREQGPTLAAEAAANLDREINETDLAEALARELAALLTAGAGPATAT